MSEDLTDSPEDLREWLEQFPPADEAIRELEANKTDWDRVPSFVAGYLKGLFVNDIYAALEDQKLSQSDLAERLGESRQYVSRVLKEQSNFTIASMAKLACALGLRLSVKLHKPDERLELRKITRKQNVVALRKAAPKRTQRASVGKEPAVYEGDKKIQKAKSPRKQTGRGKTTRSL